jgi:hypothetical protein
MNLVKKFLQMDNQVLIGCITKILNNTTIHSNISHYLFQFEYFVYTVALFIQLQTSTPIWTVQSIYKKPCFCKSTYTRYTLLHDHSSMEWNCHHCCCLIQWPLNYWMTVSCTAHIFPTCHIQAHADVCTCTHMKFDNFITHSPVTKNTNIKLVIIVDSHLWLRNRLLWST